MYLWGGGGWISESLALSLSISRSLSFYLSLFLFLPISLASSSLGAIVLRWLHLFGKFAHHILVDNRIQIASEHVDKPPVPDVQFARQRATDVHGDHAIARVQQTRPDVRQEDDAGAAGGRQGKISKIIY